MKKLYTLLAAMLLSAGISDFIIVKAQHKIVCIKGPVPVDLDAQLRCYHHYDVSTKDGYHCYIRFELGKGIKFVEDRENNVLPQEYGTTHLATYEIKTKVGNFPAALKFKQSIIGVGKGKINIQILVKPDDKTAREIVDALGMNPRAHEMQQIMLENNLPNFEKIKSILGKPFENCAVEVYRK